MDSNVREAGLARLAAAAAALKKNGFDAEIMRDGASAAAAVLKLAGKGVRVGLGGSVTVTQLGLPAALAAAGCEVVTHRPEMSPEEKRRTWLKAQGADLYVASPQAVTLDGKMIFIDGNGNRAAAVIYGPGKVVLIAGVNKLVKDQAAGLCRMRDEAAIPNNIRLNKDNPCVKAGRCVDCDSPQRICSAVVMLWKKPRMTDYKVLLVNESLGY